MAIAELLKSNANVQIVCTLHDLKEVILSVVGSMQQTQQPQEQYLTINEVCDRLQISKPTLWRYEKSRYLVPTRVGRSVRYLESDINKIMEGRQYGNKN